MSKPIEWCKCSEGCAYHPAPLIAAAPEMLAALKRAKTVLFNESAAENQPRLVSAWEQVCAAIAKAEAV